MSLTISGETRVSELIEAYPEAEELLIEMAPQFKALRNPVLRRTVARVASLEQAARVGGLEPRELVLALRSALGVEGEEVARDPVGDRAEAPGWVAGCEAAVRMDADALLADGKTPISEATSALGGLETGQLLLVEASFEPAPLVDALRTKGHDLYCEAIEGGRWRVWIRRS